MAALLRDGTTRRLIILGGLELHGPSYLFEEVESHWDELLNRTSIPPEELRKVLRVLRSYISEHVHADYESRVGDAESILTEGDPDDVPYVALALALGADGVWSEDRGLRTGESLQVYRTHEVLEVVRGHPEYVCHE